LSGLLEAKTKISAYTSIGISSYSKSKGHTISEGGTQ